MKVSICAIIKNEHLFLKEWIDWHLSIGFDSIFLCEDVGSIPHDDIVKEYDNVTLFRYNEQLFSKYPSYEGSGHQIKTYRYFLDVNPTDCDWVAFIDIDEFIHIDDGKTIKELLSDYTDYNGLYLYWKYYSANGHVERPQMNVQDAYTQEVDFAEDNGWKYKSIVNLHKCREMKNVHTVVNGVNTFKLKTQRIRTFHKIHIKHYFTKSWEDWCTRFISRGDTFPGHRKLYQFFSLNTDMILQKTELEDFYKIKLHEFQKTKNL